jgi:hypothetical protein
MNNNNHGTAKITVPEAANGNEQPDAKAFDLKERERLDKIWDAAVRATFGVLDEQKARTDIAGIGDSVDRLGRLLYLRLNMNAAIRTGERDA